MDEGNVEVTIPDICGAYYRAHLVDVDLDRKRASVTFKNNWMPPAEVGLSHVRLPQTSPSPGAEGLHVGQAVEALMPHHEHEPPGWWAGTLGKIKGELMVVEFHDRDQTYSDIVEGDCVRPFNPNLSLDSVEMCKGVFPVPPDTQMFCRVLGAHQKFKEKIGALVVTYHESAQSLIVLSQTDGPVELASLLIDMHFRNLRTKGLLTSHNEETSRRLEEMKGKSSHHDNCHVEEFYVPQDLFGLVIGIKGQNLQAARKIDGVVQVLLDDDQSKVRVIAETAQAAAKARDMLEYASEEVRIPRDLAAKVIGKKGQVIQDIMEKSGVVNVKILGDEEARDRQVDTTSEVPFTFTGLRKSIVNAHLMVDYLMEDLKDIQKLIESREELDYQLNRLRMDSQPTNYPAPSRRTHGHSSAVSSREMTLKDSGESGMQVPLLKGGAMQQLQQQPAVQEAEVNGTQDESEDNDEASPSAFSQEDEGEEERRDVSSFNSDSRGRGKNRWDRRGYRSHRGGRGGGGSQVPQQRVTSGGGGGGGGPQSTIVHAASGPARGTGVRGAYQGGRSGGGQYRQQQRPLSQRQRGGGEGGMGRRGQATEGGGW